MKFAKSLFFLLMGSVAVSTGANANLNLRYDLEAKIREKVSSLVTPYDSRAQVAVTVELKRLSLVLPGTSGQDATLESTAGMGNISVQDIEKVKITILLNKSRVPDSVQELIASTMGIPRSKLEIEFKEANPNSMDDQRSGFISRVTEQSEKFLGLFASVESKLGQLFGVALGALGVMVGIFTFNVLGVLFFKKASAEHVKAIQELSTEVKNRESGGKMVNESLFTPSLPSFTSRPDQAVRDDDPVIQTLPEASLVSLVSDCYWSKNDAYAAYLWAQMSTSQKNSFLTGWKWASQYTEFLSEIRPQSENYHHHPYYFKPSVLANVSNEDFFKLVRKNPSLWSLCSPIRKKACPFSVMEVIELSKNELIPTEIELNVISHKRELSLKLPFQQITDADEIAIYENPSLIPESFRPQIRSLVWFALLPLEDRKAILKDWSANQLSEVWIGPDVVLDRFKEAISEKKLPLVQEYQAKIAKDRNHVLMGELVTAALSKLNLDYENSKKVA